MSDTSSFVSLSASLLGASLAGSRPCSAPASLCALLGGQPAGRWRPGDPGAAPVRGRTQWVGLRASAAGPRAGARAGGGLDTLCQL